MQTSKKFIQDIEIAQSDAMSLHEIFIDSVNNCPICGSALEFEYRSEAYDNAMTEKAHCNECRIRIRDQHHCVH